MLVCVCCVCVCVCVCACMHVRYVCVYVYMCVCFLYFLCVRFGNVYFTNVFNAKKTFWIWISMCVFICECVFLPLQMLVIIPVIHRPLRKGWGAGPPNLRLRGAAPRGWRAPTTATSFEVSVTGPGLGRPRGGAPAVKMWARALTDDPRTRAGIQPPQLRLGPLSAAKICGR